MKPPIAKRGGAAGRKARSQGLNSPTTRSSSTDRIDKKAPALTGSRSFLRPSDESFWHGIGIFPKGLGRLGRLATVREDAHQLLAALGIGNLRLLSEQAGIIKPDEASDRLLSDFLLAESDPETVIHLREFMRRRAEAIEAAFQHVFRRKAKAFDASLAELSPRRPEVLKPLSKLLLLYRENPLHLCDIHTEALWTSRPTSFEYETSAALPVRAIRQLKTKADQLCKALARVIGGQPVQFLGARTSTEGFSVFVFVREFNGVVRPDFREQYNVHHGCGLILFGLDKSRRRVFIKSGNRDVAATVADYVKTSFDVDIRLLHDEVFADYTTEELRDRVLGSYPTDIGLEIVAASFARAGFGNHGPLTLGTPFLQPSIRTELEFLSHDSLIDIHGPGDITSLTVTFDGRSVTVTTSILSGGAVRYGYDNAGWDTQRRELFEKTFFRAFGVPLNRLLHPARAALGTMAIYAHLLTIANEDEVHPYQEDSLRSLIERNLIVMEPIDTRTCRNNLCHERNKPIDDPARTICGKCERELRDWRMNRLDRNEDRIASFVATVFDDADDWQWNNRPSELETTKYFELRRRREDGREDTIFMLLADRPSAKAKQLFDRTGLPILFVQAQTDARHVYVDTDGNGHASLAYLLSAQESVATKHECKNLCSDALRRLIRNHEERILKAARLSCDRMVDTGTAFNGDGYEMDVFNLLRSIFPYTYNLGRRGKIEPDGFVCVPTYETSSLEDVGSWNWSYDAKYSARAKGYKFDIDECRKIVNYIRKLRRNRKALFGEDRKLRAHVIISNNLSEDRMAAVSQEVFGPDGVGKEQRDVRLLLMKQEFLVTLYEQVRSNSEALARRRAFFGDEFSKILQSSPEGSYRTLGQADARSLINDVLQLPEIESNVDRRVLLDSLNDRTEPSPAGQTS